MDIRLIRNFIIFVTISNTLLGCHKPLSYPETKDPIFSDILQDLEFSKGRHEQAVKDVAKAQDDYNKAPLRSRQRRQAEELLYESKKRFDLAEQDLLYKVQRVSNRRKLDRETYKKAFEEGKEWPRPEEYSEYQLHKKLEHASREWTPHVSSRSAAVEGSGQAEGHGESGGHSAPEGHH